MSKMKINMMQKILIIHLMLLVHCYCFSQQDYNPYATRIQQEAEKMSTILLKNDPKNFEEYVFPSIVKKMRGNRQLIALLKDNIKHIQITSITLGNPSKIILSKGELQCTLQEIMELNIQNKKKIIVKSTLIAISPDKGKKWYFIEANQNLETLQEGLPNLSENLIIPPNEKPILIE